MRVLVNAAMSLDGRIALRGGKRLRLSDETDMRRVHALRASCDAILVGIGTVLADDPRLSARTGEDARQPLRVVLDSRGRTPPTARVLDGAAPALVFVAKGHARPLAHAEVVEVGSDEGGVDLRAALDALSARGVRNLLVEGGSRVIGAFLAAGLVDEMTVYVAPVVVGGGAPGLVEGPGADRADAVKGLKLTEATPLGEGVLLRYVPA